MNVFVALGFLAGLGIVWVVMNWPRPPRKFEPLSPKDQRLLCILTRPHRIPASWWKEGADMKAFYEDRA